MRLSDTLFVLLPLLLVLSACSDSYDDDSSSNNSSNSMPLGFHVSTVTPADGTTLTTFPATIEIVFSEPVDETTLAAATVQLLQSGGDDSFDDGNESIVDWNGATTSNNSVILDFSGTSLDGDSFQLAINYDAGSSLLSSAGDMLDGDSDGSPGGKFTLVFTVDASMPPTNTLSAIQADIFSVSCAVSGCHTGAMPPLGLNLSAGQAYTNIVGVASQEVPSLQRIEPGNPTDSYLIQKVSGIAAVGGQMPLGGTPLSSAQIQNLIDWVNNGAMDN